jgi:hypothetical protein
LQWLVGELQNEDIGADEYVASPAGDLDSDGTATILDLQRLVNVLLGS